MPEKKEIRCPICNQNNEAGRKEGKSCGGALAGIGLAAGPAKNAFEQAKRNEKPKEIERATD